jgi:hypothetical protein
MCLATFFHVLSQRSITLLATGKTARSPGPYSSFKEDRMRKTSVLILAVLVMRAASAGEPSAGAKEELKKLQGVWRVIKGDNGVPAEGKDSVLQGARLVIKDNTTSCWNKDANGRRITQRFQSPPANLQNGSP